MRLTRWVLFGLLAATVIAVVALYITSNIGKGPPHTFRLVPQAAATEAELRSDAGTMVTRLQNLGYTTEAEVGNGSIEVTMFGSEPELRSAVVSSLVQGRLYVRPVECAAPPYDPRASQSAPVPLECAERYVMSAGVLEVDTRTGLARVRVQPQPDLSAVPSASVSNEPRGERVLVPTGPGSGFSGKRLVLGPASLDNSDIASAQASDSPHSGWIVDLTLTTDGENAYDVLSEDQFHAYIAFEVDATAVSVPLTLPTQADDTPAGDTVEMAGDFDKTEAVALANALTSPLAVPLELTG